MSDITAELQKDLQCKPSTRKQGGISVSYVEGWYVQDESNKVFGFLDWDDETIYCKEVSRVDTEIGQYKKAGFKVGYEAKVRITVRHEGKTAVREGTGHGSGIATDLFDAIEGAAKEAETDAMKRAFKSFGNRFGLSLYNKDAKNSTVAPQNTNTGASRGGNEASAAPATQNSDGKKVSDHGLTKEELLSLIDKVRPVCSKTDILDKLRPKIEQYGEQAFLSDKMHNYLRDMEKQINDNDLNDEIPFAWLLPLLAIIPLGGF